MSAPQHGEQQHGATRQRGPRVISSFTRYIPSIKVRSLAHSSKSPAKNMIAPMKSGYCSADLPVMGSGGGFSADSPVMGSGGGFG